MDKHVSAIVDLPPELMLSSEVVFGKYPFSIFKTIRIYHECDGWIENLSQGSLLGITRLAE